MKKNNAEEKMEGGVISIANCKGGVGKTTLTVNIAYELVFQGYSVALLDLDNQCDLSKIYLPEDHQGPTIMDVLQKQSTLSNALTEVEENLYLIPGSREIAQLNYSGSEHILQRVIAGIKKRNIDFILLDHPPSMHEAALAGYVASDYVLIVSEAEAFSVMNLSQLLEDIAAIKSAFRPELRILGIVMNKIDRRRNLTKKTLKACNEAFGKSKTLLHTTISIDTAIPNAHALKIPVRKLHWRSRTVRQFSELTHEILERMRK